MAANTKLDKLYRRVEICERLLNILECKIGIQPSVNGSISPGLNIREESIIFPWQNEARVVYKGKEYYLNYGAVGTLTGYQSLGDFDIIPNRNKWLNISKKDLLFLRKIRPRIREVRWDAFMKEMSKLWDKDKLTPLGEIMTDVERGPKGEQEPQRVRLKLWTDIWEQLIPTSFNSVEIILRDEINEALFESRFRIYEIKKPPPYVIGTSNPLLTPRMNQFMPTNSPPVSPRHSSSRRAALKNNGTQKLAPRVF